MTFSLAFLTGSNAIFLAGKTTEIKEYESAHHEHFTKPLTIALMIALQVERTSFGFHLRECMGSWTLCHQTRGSKISNIPGHCMILFVSCKLVLDIWGSVV